jgi:hypothetical protein
MRDIKQKLYRRSWLIDKNLKKTLLISCDTKKVDIIFLASETEAHFFKTLISTVNGFSNDIGSVFL